VRRYHCKRCRITFSDSTSPHTQYPENVILHTIEQYNRGYPVTVARKMTGKKYQYSPPISTIYAWIKRYEDILTFTKLRRKYHLDPDQLITVHKLDHGQIYPFKYHNLKLNIHSKGRPELRRYINWVERSLDRSMFLKGPRASSLRIDREAVIKEVDSRLPEMTLLPDQRFLDRDNGATCFPLSQGNGPENRRCAIWTYRPDPGKVRNTPYT